MDDKIEIAAAFESRTEIVRLADIVPLHLLPQATKDSPKYRQIRSSVLSIGLVEPPVVARDKDEPGKYLLVDGHLRIEIMRELGTEQLECLIATDDEAFTYNKRVSRIATIQEHLMILKAIDRGVPEDEIARTLNVNVAHVRSKARLLNGICPEVAEMLKDRLVPHNTFGELRKMLPVRQVEAAHLMIAMNKFSFNYARSLLASTPRSQLVDSKRPKKVGALNEEQMALMEQESANLDREFRLVESTYGSDNLDLVVATGYLNRLLGNARVVRYLAQNFPELLSEFNKIVEAPRSVA